MAPLDFGVRLELFGHEGSPPMMRFRLTIRPILASLVAILFQSSISSAATVTGIRADFRDGQTFVTWDNLPGSGWLYHVYSSSIPIVDLGSLDYATELAQVGDRSAVDARISTLLGQTLTYRIAPDQPPLPCSRGLFVATPTIGALTYYAVVAQLIGMTGDYTVLRGANATPTPVLEQVQRPRPVWQRTLTRPPGEDYVLWTTNVGTSDFRAMCNLPGWAYHVGIIRGERGGALVLGGHGRGGSFLNSLHGTGVGGEWVMSIDDHLPTADMSSFYFGYEAGYDLEQPYNGVRAPGGVVVDYTEQRVMYLLQWANREIPYDPHRVYAMGGSMGGSFAFFLAWHHPDLIAGSLAVIPKLCCAYTPDSYVGFRESMNRMWGTPSLDLPTTAGLRVFQWMDGREQARLQRHRGSAPIIGTCGTADVSVGWGEKVAYFQALESLNAGGVWYWDGSDHYTPLDQSPWYPVMAGNMLYKYRNDMSYPAFAHCSTDGNFGNGAPATADPLGQINANADYDENTIQDESLEWSLSLRTRGLQTRTATYPAPASLTVDVTPRRLQQFLVAQSVSYRWEVRRLADGSIIQSGEATPDQDAVLTIPQVHVLADGVRLSVAPTSITGVPRGRSSGPRLALSRNPVRDRATLTIDWPGEGDGVVQLFDTQGRLVRTELAGSVKGLTERPFRTDGLAPGLYILSAKQGLAHATRRVTVLE